MPNSWFFCEYDRRDIQKHHLNYLGIRENDFSDNLWSIANNRRINCRINLVEETTMTTTKKRIIAICVKHRWSSKHTPRWWKCQFVYRHSCVPCPHLLEYKKKHVRSSKWSTQQIKVRAITLSHPYSLFQNGNSCFLWSKLHCHFIWSIWLQLINPEGKVFYYFQRRMGK